MKDVEKKRKEAAKEKQKESAISWKMFIGMFIFYLLMAFKNVLWNYFFPKASKKGGGGGKR